MVHATPTAAGTERVQQNHASFEAAVAGARRRFEAGRLVEAAVEVGLASNLATWMHPGLFASGALEQLAVDIGRSIAPPSSPARPPRPRGEQVRDVLHVISRALGIGGHTRMIWRWMALDAGRRHSVAVTRQGGGPVPPELVSAAAATGGRVTVLNSTPGSLTSWANDLHGLATQADVVVLHIDPEDVIPVVAFADRSDLPPVLYINHADHLFWLGVGISDLVVNLRRSGHLLSAARRGVPAERNAFMPIALGERARTTSRAEAKRQLGHPEDAVLLLTVARPVKFEYRSETGESYLDAVLPVIQETEAARLVLVGPSSDGDFQRAREATGGRVVALGERTDNDLLYQAADVYIDSFPQPSPTSLLEAGSYGVPLIGLCPHPESAAILCADAPGIDEHLIRARNVDELRHRLRGLITDPTAAMALGTRTKSDIERLHGSAGWQNELERLYVRATTTSPLLDVPDIGDVPNLGSPDATIALASPPVVDIQDLLPHHMRLLPLRARASTWVRARRERRPLSPALLLSERTAAELKRARTRRHA